MAAGITDTLDRVTDSTTGRPVISALASPGKAMAAATINLTDVTNWTTTTVIHFTIYNTITVAGVQIKDVSTQTDWKGTLAGTTISNLTITGGTDRAYTAGAVVELTPTSRWAKDLYDNVSAHSNQDGTLKTSAVQAALNIGTIPADYTALATVPSTITHNGNRNYTVVIPGVDYTDRLNPATRLRTVRTTASPNQCTSLNGTTQFYSKTSPNKMTFTDDFAEGIWVKLAAYPATFAGLITRYNGTSGYSFDVSSTGQVRLVGLNGGAANPSSVTSYQSLQLSKWTFLAAQLDMSAFTATPTTSYVMFDGLDVPAFVSRGGTNPTALIQAGDFQVGAQNSLLFLSAKVAQASVFNAKVTQATYRNYMSQGLVGNEPNLSSAYSFSNSITDLNTTTPNDLTANGSAVATNADSFAGTQASGLISTTVDYAIVQTATFSTDTTLNVQVPEGCTLSTTGVIQSWSYSSAKAPYGFPAAVSKWVVECYHRNSETVSIASANIWYPANVRLTIPLGKWRLLYQASLRFDSSVSGNRSPFSTVDNSPTNADYGAPGVSRFFASNTTLAVNMFQKTRFIDLAAATNFTLYGGVDSTTGVETYGVNAGQGGSFITVENGYL